MSFLNKIFSGNTLYYPGCLTKFVGLDLETKNKYLLRKVGVDFIVLPELEICCGSPVLRAGYPEEFNKIAEQNNKLFVDHGISRIITNCPACFSIFQKEYADSLKSEWKMKVEHTSQVFYQALKENKLKLNYRHGQVTYHDPCHLGRQMGIYREPRELIKACGYELVEMDFIGKQSYCCGAGGGVQSNELELSKKIGQARAEQAEKTKAEILCTACPMCYFQLKENNQSKKLKVVELIELLEDASNYEPSR
jgi:heterodisulfide reductase subunit D